MPYLTRAMTESITIEKVFKEIQAVKEEVSFIKKHMFDPDTIMTSEESRRFEQALKEFHEGKTISLDKLKTEF